MESLFKLPDEYKALRESARALSEKKITPGNKILQWKVQ
jgi:hypothetical protein